MILIGSHAIKHWYSDFPREPKDIDFIVKKPPLNKFQGVEFLENSVFDGSQDRVLFPDELYTLKFSHVIGWNINWEKHMWDLQFLRKKGAVLDRVLFKNLYNYWVELHGKNKRSDLEMTAEDFFTNSVDSPHEHDYLHTLLNPSPTFKKILKDEVAVCEDKIRALSFEEKTDLVREEVMVMASERYKGLGYRDRYARMLKKFIISHAPLEVGIFAIENYILLERAPFDFMAVLNTKLKQQNLQILN